MNNGEIFLLIVKELQDKSLAIAKSDGSNILGIQVTIIFMLIASFGLLSANPFITFLGFCMVPALWNLLYKPGEPAVLLFCALFQWIQAFAQVISANIEGRTLDAVFGGPQLEWAAWLSLTSVLVLSLGMRSANWIFPRLRINNSRMQNEIKHLDSRRLAILYFILLMFSICITYASGYAGGLRQPLLAFAYIKWVPLILLAWTTLQNRRAPHFLILVVTAEIALGFISYFSTFKSVIFVLLIVGLGITNERGRFRILPIMVSMLIFIPLIGFWQAVKSEYRLFLNQGTGQQVVMVSIPERLAFLAKSASGVELLDISNGIVTGIERLGYLDFFALSLLAVPSQIPHENGDLWFGAIKHTVMPRLLFPDKPVLNESERTMRYTQVRIAGENEGTAISLGYPAESYIDFGMYGMFIPIFLLGLFLGWVYRWFSTRGPYYVFGNALGICLLLFSGHQLETSNVKIFGGLVAGIIAFALVNKFTVPLMWRYCTSRELQKS
jgi:hypothetical protein